MNNIPDVKRILIVDDNESIHHDFKKVLRGKEDNLLDLEAELFGGDEDDSSNLASQIVYEIDDAYQGEEAVEMVDKAEKEGAPYAVIFMDVRMPPGINGIKAITEIWKKYPDKELVLCTAYSDYSWSEMLNQIGVTDKLQFIRKPFDMVSVQQLALSLSTKWQLGIQSRLQIQQLEEAIQEKEHAQEELHKLNMTLEKRIEERTSQLSRKNDALEAAMNELRAAQDHLVASEKMAALGGLVAGIAHEINTPVGIGVTAASHLALETKKLVQLFNDQTLKKSDFASFLGLCRESTDMILCNLDRASELIQSFKKVAVDQSSEERRVFKVKEYIQEVLLSLRPKLKKTMHRLEVECEDNIELNSFPGVFGQVISNFVMNTLIHAYDKGDEGVMRFEVTREGKGIHLIYSDDGRGIPEDSLKKIFDPFYTTKRGEGGSGLGLHIVYNIATRNLGGTIHCESAPGKGTKFKLWIPVEGPVTAPVVVGESRT